MNASSICADVRGGAYAKTATAAATAHSVASFGRLTECATGSRTGSRRATYIGLSAPSQFRDAGSRSLFTHSESNGAAHCLYAPARTPTAPLQFHPARFEQ